MRFSSSSASKPADDYELAPRIFVYKSTGPTVVVGGDFVINYLVINNGDAKAKDIQISDKYDPSLFTGLANIDENGEVTFNLDELDVNEKISFNATVSPKLHGIYESTRARVKYSSGAITKTEEEEDGENADDPMLGFSTSMGKIRILSVEEYEGFVKTLFGVVRLLRLRSSLQWLSQETSGGRSERLKKIEF